MRHSSAYRGKDRGGNGSQKDWRRLCERLLGGLLGCLLLSGVACKGPDATGSQGSKAEQGFSDLHNSVLYQLLQSEDFTLFQDSARAVSLSGMKAAQSKLIVLSIGVPRFDLRHSEAIDIKGIHAFLKRFREWSERHAGNQLAFVGNAGQAADAIQAGKTACVLGLEGAWSLAHELQDGQENALRWVDSLVAVGVKTIGIAHRFQNGFFEKADGKTVRPEEGPVFLNQETGLSEAGRALIHRLLEKGILLDVSHLPEKAFWQVVKLNQAQTPLIASHANVYELCAVPRNLKKEQIGAIVASKGLIGVCIHQPMLIKRAFRETEGAISGIGEVVDHIEWLMREAGEDHVGIGTDLEGNITPAEGLEKIDRMDAVRAEMLRRGYSREVIEKVMWQNAIRVWGGKGID